MFPFPYNLYAFQEPYIMPVGPKKPLHFHLDIYKLSKQGLEKSNGRLRIPLPQSVSPEGSPVLVCVLTNVLVLSYLALIRAIETPSLFRCEMSKTI